MYPRGVPFHTIEAKIGWGIMAYFSEMESYFESNRQLWDVRTGIHIASAFYDVPGFIQGESSLRPVERVEMGDVKGLRLLHLQCHFGLDSLSWVREGAIVTAVDFSSRALQEAQKLADRTRLKADFVEANVMELDLSKQFDRVFTSYGVLGWLPDLQRWAKVVYHHLKTGGIFYLIEFHPFFMQLDEAGSVHYSYFYQPTPDRDEETTTYTDGPAHQVLESYWWNHSLSDVINALMETGLEIEYIHEFPYCAYPLSPSMVKVAEQQWEHRVLKNRIPYMYSIRAQKPR